MFHRGNDSNREVCRVDHKLIYNLGYTFIEPIYTWEGLEPDFELECSFTWT